MGGDDGTAKGGPKKDGPNREGARRIDPGPEIVGVWPAAVWILVGTGHYLTDPDQFAGWKGALYFVLGTGLVALVGGIAGLSTRRTVAGIQDRLLKEIRHRRDLATWVVALALRGLVGLGEAVLVTLLALWVLALLG
ncbi:hypothetical protein VY88_09915 [Azospirillum thiophilum]|uniref:Uncharacterized protein n=1 Tax=Azospirillum thiophilum TaxID=528244 RepID=A0AAC8VVD2_9PROT|nr:hypothetical protein [Azospirillum thiophilum]ALG70022.1 hypothetical protein AL072_02795 [Azospirillum thiophilum]KJR66296.1 hypothetical protein VY88_09915 [Azospirillum thiophilum]